MGSSLVRGLAKGVGSGYGTGFNNQAALIRALLASGQMDMAMDPIMREETTGARSSMGGPIVEGPGGMAITGSEGEVAPEAMGRKFMAPTGRYNMRLQPNPYGNLKRQLQLSQIQNRESNRKMAMDRLAMQHASNMSDVFKDPETYNQAYMEKLQQLEAMQGLKAKLNNPGMSGSPGRTMRSGGEEEMAINQIVQMIMELGPEEQQYALENLGDDAYAEMVRERVMSQLNEDIDIPGNMMEPRLMYSR